MEPFFGKSLEAGRVALSRQVSNLAQPQFLHLEDGTPPPQYGPEDRKSPSQESARHRAAPLSPLSSSCGNRRSSPLKFRPTNNIRVGGIGTQMEREGSALHHVWGCV